jgi:mannitol operon transcriptional antiterminator
VIFLYIQGRERKIIEILLANTTTLPIKELAQQLDVSVRTIHRDLKNVEEILKEYQLSLNKKSGIGIYIDGTDEKKDLLKMMLLNSNLTDYTPEERQAIIFAHLLNANGPVKLFTLANELNVTNATISNDLDAIQPFFEKHNLELIRKRGLGVHVKGKESDKRSALSSIISKYVNENDLISLLRENIEKKSKSHLDSISNRLLGLVDHRKLIAIEKSVENLRKELPYELADSSYIGLVVHLALAIERLQKGENIRFDPAYLEELKGSQEYSFAKKLIHSLEKLFEMDIPDDEIGYITMHLRGAKLRYDTDFTVEESSLDLAFKAKELIQFVSAEVQADISDNGKLLKDLIAHLKPAIFRLKQGMNIKNPLLKEIEKDYTLLFSIIEEGVKEVFPKIPFPKEEIGYLVLHFASQLLNVEEDVSLIALVVCSSGIGTSKMLASQIKQQVPEIQKVENRSLFELERMNLSDYDLIISTVPIQNIKEKYILTSPFLSKSELQEIKSEIAKRKIAIRSTKKEKAVTDDINIKEKTEVISQLETVQSYSKIIIELLKQFSALSVSKIGTIKEILTEACLSLQKKNIVTNCDLVIEELLQRESVGGLAIPNTRIALYHTRSENVSKPSFHAIFLDGFVTVKGMDNDDTEIDSILLMLAPMQMNEKAMEILSFISSLIIQDDNSLDIFQSKNEEKISSYLSSQLFHFIKQKFTS